MSTIPAPPTHSVGDILTAADINKIRDAIQWAQGATVTGGTGPRPLAILGANTPTSIVDNTTTPVAFDTETTDLDNMHSTTTNNSRLTVNTAGVYLFLGGIGFQGSSTSYRELLFQFNGSGALRFANVRVAPLAAPLITKISVSFMRTCAVGDFVELAAGQNTGGPLNTDPASCYFQAMFVHA